MELVTVHNIDAIELITKRDGSDVFMYLDPPYVGARQGHYSGYSQVKFNGLIEFSWMSMSKSVGFGSEEY